MAKSINRATLLGNLGKNPELRSTPQGSSVCSFTIATSDSYKDKNGEWQETTEWHNVVCWEWLANYAAENLRKGSKVYVEGKIKNRSYEGKDGITRYVTEIQAQNVINLVGKEKSSGSYSSSSAPSDYHPSDYVQTSPDSSNAIDDDDVPF